MLKAGTHEQACAIMYKRSYIRAFDRMLENKAFKHGNTGEEVMDWWLHGGSDSDELTLLDGYDEEGNHE
jgi:hypothetical protein